MPDLHLATVTVMEYPPSYRYDDSYLQEIYGLSAAEILDTGVTVAEYEQLHARDRAVRRRRRQRGRRLQELGRTGP